MPLVARLRFGARVSAVMPRYDLGGDVPVYIEFRDLVTNALTNAVGVALAVQKADGTDLSPAPTITAVSTGIYLAVITPDQPGVWQVTGSATTSGTINDVRELLMVSDTVPPAVVGPTAVTAVNGQPGPTVSLDALTLAYQALAESEARTIAARLAERISVLDFGAVGDGATDDTAAIQAAIDTGLNIYFPARRYRIVGTLVVETRGQVLFADTIKAGGIESQIAAARIAGSAVAVLEHTTAISEPILWVKAGQVTLIGLGFSGVSKSTSLLGVRFQTITNTDDVDGYMIGCAIGNVDTCVEHYNRAMNAHDCVFYNANVGFELIWDSTDADYTDPVQDLPLGWRATSIIRGRMHSVVKMVVTSGAALRGAIIALNSLDLGERLIESSGGLLRCLIVDNIADQCSTAAIYCSDGAIVDTSFSGNQMGGTEGDAVQTMAFAIQFVDCTEITNVKIDGNTFSEVEGSAVFLDGAATVVTGLSLQGNTINRVGIAGSPNAALLATEADIDGLCVMGTISVTTPPPYLVYMVGCTLTNSVIMGNARDPALPVISTFTDGGGNQIVAGPFTVNADGDIAGRRIGAGVASPAFSLHASGTASLAMRLTRTGSTAGVGFSLLNDAGEVRLFGIPTGSGVGSFVPETDGTVGLGLGANRWGQSYITTLRVGGASAPFRTLHVNSTDAALARLQRDASTAGVTIEYTNDAGTVALGATPTGSNAGAVLVTSDNSVDLGAASARFKDAYIASIRLGTGATIETCEAGSPEGMVTAAVGSRYWRTDGGSGSRLYFKATGSGNTGWVAIL